MITRVRIEAEGSTPEEVMRQLDTAHAALKIETLPAGMADLMFGEPNERGGRAGLSDAQPGECVVERFGRDTGGEAGHGGIVYRGRMTAHYAKPQNLEKLTGHSTWPSSGPVSEAPIPEPQPAVSFDEVRSVEHLTGEQLWAFVRRKKEGTVEVSADLWVLVGSQPVERVAKQAIEAFTGLDRYYKGVVIQDELPDVGWLVTMSKPASMRVTAASENWTRVGTTSSSDFEVTSTQGREVPVDRVPPLNQPTDAELTVDRLVATWNENVPPVQRPNQDPLRLLVAQGDLYVRAEQLWQTSEQLRALYERPVEAPSLDAKQWLVSPRSGVGG